MRRYRFASLLAFAAVACSSQHAAVPDPARYAAEIGRDTTRLTITNPPVQPGRERRTVLARLR